MYLKTQFPLTWHFLPRFALGIYLCYDLPGVDWHSDRFDYGLVIGSTLLLAAFLWRDLHVARERAKQQAEDLLLRRHAAERAYRRTSRGN